jgi:hypothetical protein
VEAAHRDARPFQRRRVGGGGRALDQQHLRQGRRGGQLGQQRVGVVAPAAQRAGARLRGEARAQRRVGRQPLEPRLDRGGDRRRTR